ncbi:unnamed protein product, partial [Ixodes pacificus]
ALLEKHSQAYTCFHLRRGEAGQPRPPRKQQGGSDCGVPWRQHTGWARKAATALTWDPHCRQR